MELSAQAAPVQDIVPWRDHHRQEMNCQIVHDSLHSRNGWTRSYLLVQELKRVCYEQGNVPAARCNPTNIASRNSLQKAGFDPCGHILSGPVAVQLRFESRELARHDSPFS